MNDGPGLDLLELRRRLSDLAESAEAEQPWDDPLPHLLGAAATVERELPPRRPLTVVRERVSRIAFNPVPIISVAAAFLVIALIGVLLHGAGGSQEKKASAGSAAGTEAGAGSPAANSSPAAGTAIPPGGTGSERVPQASSCVTFTPSPSVKLSAPGELVQGDVIRVRVATSGGLRLTSATILVRSGLNVVGRLIPTAVTPAPSSGSVGSFVVTGRLIRTSASCRYLPANSVPAPVSPFASPPPGHYLLVVTGSTSAGRVVSAPVAITIHR